MHHHPDKGSCFYGMKEKIARLELRKAGDRNARRDFHLRRPRLSDDTKRRHRYSAASSAVSRPRFNPSIPGVNGTFILIIADSARSSWLCATPKASLYALPPPI